jgi:hypothetical protein
MAGQNVAIAWSLPCRMGTGCVSACKFDPLSRGIGVQN